MLLAALLFATPYTDASAETTTVIEVPSPFHFDFLYDETNDLIFISERVGPRVFVYDLDGQLVSEIDGLQKAHGLAVSPDGSTLWVALPKQREIAKVDIASFTEVDRIVLPNNSCPAELVALTTKLAVAHSCESYGTGSNPGGIGVVDLANGNAWESIRYDDAERPGILGSAGLGETVVFREDTRDDGEGSVDVYDISTGTPVLLLDDVGPTRGATSIDADGSALLAIPSDSALAVYDFPDLVRDEIYGFFDDVYPAKWAVDRDFFVMVRDRDSVEVFDTSREVVVGTYDVSYREGVVDIAATRGAGTVMFLTDRSRDDPLKLYIIDRGPRGYTCFGEPATIVGTEGPDRIELSGSRDVVVSLGGDDSIERAGDGDLVCAGEGDDWIRHAAPGSHIKGGAGKDWISYNGSGTTEPVVIDLGADWYPGAPFPELISIENIAGSRYADLLIGDDKRNIIWGEGGADEIYGMGGNDKLVGTGSRETMYGGAGDDVLRGWGERDQLYGGPGNDWLRGDSDADLLVGGSGDDLLEGGGRNDTLDGGSGNDELLGNGGDDLLLGGSGRDVLRGNAGNDTLAGEAGADQLLGGSGADTASFAFAPAGVLVSLTDGFARGEGRDDLNAMEWIVGSARNDHLIGDNGPNLIESREGDDSIEALGGDDLIHAGEGTDTIWAGTGTDYCIAGEITLSCETDEPAAEAFDAVPRTEPSRYELPWGPS